MAEQSAPLLALRRRATRQGLWIKMWRVGGVHVDTQISLGHYIWGTGGHFNTTYSVPHSGMYEWAERAMPERGKGRRLWKPAVLG